VLEHVPAETLERLSFKVFQVALVMAAEAISRRAQAKAAVTQPSMRSATRPEKGGDRLVNIHEASKIFGLSRSWLYRNAPQLPFTRRVSGGRLRFSYRGMMEYLDTLGTGKNPQQK
jgi:hypothetical protein